MMEFLIDWAWWIGGAGIIAVYIFAFALAKAAGDADRWAGLK